MFGDQAPGTEELPVLLLHLRYGFSVKNLRREEEEACRRVWMGSRKGIAQQIYFPVYSNW